MKDDQARQVFAYWDGDDQSMIDAFKNHWQEAFPEFRVIGNADVIRLLEAYFPEHIDLYRSIRIPAPKSDIARYLWLYEFGGLYVDCHMSIKDIEAVRDLFDALERVDAIFVSVSKLLRPQVPPDSRRLITGMIFARPRQQMFLDVLRQALANLAWLKNREALSGFLPYSIFRLVGPGLFSNMINQPGSENRELRWDLQQRVRVISEEDAPIQRNSFKRSYGDFTKHWSIREQTELLFEN